MKIHKRLSSDIIDHSKLIGMKEYEDVGTQTCDLFTHEYLLGILNEHNQINNSNTIQENCDSGLSPTSMLDRYIETCTKISTFPNSNNKTSKYKIFS